MFDEIKKQPPDDIFSKVDGAQDVPPPFRAAQSTGPAVPPLVSSPVMPSTSSNVPVDSFPQTSSAPKNKKSIILLVLVAVVVIVAGAVLSKFIFFSNPPADNLPNVSNAVPEKVNSNTTNINSVTNTVNVPPVVTPPVVEPVVEPDTDKDGLTDVREAEIGTSSTKVDTDDDGLFDFEEVETYHTNPLLADTDGDSYKDGVEVDGGYNPNGAGKLFDLPANN